ncbi:MAG: hypothetical protein M3R18_01895, partial [Pseudomonadota bacterium]|nr:hypothetical protein [Pseudomonadota bacterium]
MVTRKSWRRSFVLLVVDSEDISGLFHEINVAIGPLPAKAIILYISLSTATRCAASMTDDIAAVGSP